MVEVATVVEATDVVGVKIVGGTHLYDIRCHVVILAQLRLRNGKVAGIDGHDGGVRFRLLAALGITACCRQQDKRRQLKLSFHSV